MSPPVAQTPGVLLLSPNSDQFSAACAAALKACRIDPRSFDSYTGRCSAIKSAGKTCETNGITAANLNQANSGDYLTSQAQSGHMGQNAIFRGVGGRDDACANVPPTPFGNASAPSSYGYSTTGAPCTDHFGRSTLPGGCRGEISLTNERTVGYAGAGIERAQSLDQGTIEDRVRASARVHVDADRVTRSQPRNAAERAEVESLRNAQHQNAARLSANDPQAQALLNPNGVDAEHPNGGGTPGPDQATKDFAVECEVAKWKAGMAKMRSDAINESPLGQRAGSGGSSARNRNDLHSTDHQHHWRLQLRRPPYGQEKTVTTPFDDMHCEYGWASGADYLNAAWVTRRWRDAYGTTLSDSDFYVCGSDAGQLRFWGPSPNITPALWRALPSGRVYALDASQGSVHVYDEIGSSDPSKIRLVPMGFAGEGIWGLDEQHIYAWGIRQVGPGNQAPHLASFDGHEWREMPNPGFYITKLHGLAPDLIYAAGRDGMARWDGRQWNLLPMPTGEILSDVFVAAPDEIYATGYNGSLLEGTANGFSVITRTIDDRLPYTCVIKFADELFVGGGSLGLFRRVGLTDELELYKPKVMATSFEARAGSLVITTPFAICGTNDGQDFQGSAINSVLNQTNTINIEEA